VARSGQGAELRGGRLTARTAARLVREGKGYPRELTLPRGCRSVNGSLFGGHDHGARAEIRNDGGRGPPDGDCL
jgi:hypothetical protein